MSGTRFAFFFTDTRRRSKGRSNATVPSKRWRRCRLGRTGRRKWSGTTSCSLPFRRSSTYPPITRTIRTRPRRWAIRMYLRLTRNTRIAMYLASRRRGRITCRPKWGKRDDGHFYAGAPRGTLEYRWMFDFCINKRAKKNRTRARIGCYGNILRYFRIFGICCRFSSNFIYVENFKCWFKFCSYNTLTIFTCVKKVTK